MSLRSFPGMGMQLHVTYIFFTSSLRTVLAFLTQPRRQNYVHGRRATEGTLTLQMRATMARSLHGSAKGRLVANFIDQPVPTASVFEEGPDLGAECQARMIPH